MADKVSTEHRSKIMRAVRREHTRPEILVRQVAHRLGLRFRLHAKHLPGTPDLVFAKWHTVAFINGCFWHRHPNCKKSTTPKTNTDFWHKKFAANIQRDRSNYLQLESQGWRVIILWECEVQTENDVANLLKQYFSLPLDTPPS